MRGRRAFVTGLAMMVAGAACGCSRSASYPAVILPDAPRRTVLRIRDPVLRPDLVVQVTVHGAEGRKATLWMLLDSGATVGSLPENVAGDLALASAREVTMIAINGAVKAPLVTAPRLALGDLPIARVAFLVNTMAGAAAELGLVGQSILARMPWEISWDSGTVTLGATPWTEGGDVSSLPLEPFGFGSGVEMVVARVNGRPLKMMVDTGAFVSSIPERIANDLGLDAEVLEGRTFAGANGPFKPRHVYTADIALGSVRLERQRLVTSLSPHLAVLGRDILGQLNLLIVPGQRMLLRPRGDLRATAAQRVQRWPWMPACASVGCVRARIEPGGADARLALEIEAPLPGPIEVLFGCAETPDVPEAIVTAGQRAMDPVLPTSRPVQPGVAGQPFFRHLVVDVEQPAPGRTEKPFADASRLRASAEGAPCRDLAVLDVAPASHGRGARENVHAYLVR